MKIIIISNAITPHQIPLCDELSSNQGIDLLFIEGVDIDKSKLPIGWQASSDREYVLSYADFANNRELYSKRILEADVVVFGSAPVQYVLPRLSAQKLTLLYTERIYKNFKEKLKLAYHWFKLKKLYGVHESLHLLCASAFAASDYAKLGLFKNKAYKWGYFTPTNIDLPLIRDRFRCPLKLLWCSRFIDWKHPELAVQLAKKLRDNGYRFTLDMIGEGELIPKMKRFVEKHELADYVHFLGTMPNDQVHEQMRTHDIFLFTSDKGEGWGAVANEAMANGCVLVGSDHIGSVPYLVTHRGNGIIFKSRNIDSLYNEVCELFENTDLCRGLSCNAVATMNEVWSPKNAASSLIKLCNSILENKACPIVYGPCSKA